MDLFVRASQNDHTLVDRLCAPASAGLWTAQRLPVGGIVADATVAAARPQLAKTAATAGIPYVIDPVTPLLAWEQDANQAWARLPFAVSDAMSAEDLDHHAVLDELVELSLDFQRGQGATMLVPPYLYSPKRNDIWYELNLRLLSRSARYLERENVDLPVVPVFAGSLLEYAPRAAWHLGIDRYVDATRALNVRYVVLSWSTSQASRAGDAKLMHMMTATRHIAARAPMVAWRQGLYGLALTAAGARGYETGAGQGEQVHCPGYAANRRPQPDRDNSGGGGGASVYLSAFGRSLPRRAADAILADPGLRGSLVCTDSECCPDGVDSMIKDWREHAVRARARELDQLDAMPSTSWRLQSIAQAANRSMSDARLCNDVLEAQGIAQRLPEDTFRALGRASEALRSLASEEAA